GLKGGGKGAPSGVEEFNGIQRTSTEFNGVGCPPEQPYGPSLVRHVAQRRWVGTLPAILNLLLAQRAACLELLSVGLLHRKRFSKAFVLICGIIQQRSSWITRISLAPRSMLVPPAWSGCLVRRAREG
ncbi:MAG: hypothetical protein ACK56I_26195, partial [bacterium]